MSSSSISLITTEEQRMINFLLFTVNNLFKLFNPYGLFYVFGSAAININKGIKLNTKSDVDCMLLLNGSAPLNYSVAAVIGRLYILIDKINRRDESYFSHPNTPEESIIEISLKESQIEQIPLCKSIAAILNEFGFSVKQEPFKPGPLKWQSTPLNISPFRINVIYEYDGRFLIKLVSATPIDVLMLDTASGPVPVPVYKEYLDINVYDYNLPIAKRQIEYSKIFLRSIVKVGQFEIPTASPGMIMCQQIDLFHSRYLARIKGSRPREISTVRKSEVRALWDSLSAEQQGAVRGLFAKNIYTNVFNGKEKTVIGEFLKDIGLEGGKRKGTKGKKRRSTRKNL